MATTPSPHALLDRAERLAAATDAMSSTFARELAAVLRDLERELVTIVVEVVSSSRTVQAWAARAVRLRGELRDALEAAGYDRLTETATRAAVDRMVGELATTRVGQMVGRFVSRVPDRVTALRLLATQDLLHQGDEIAIALWRSLKDAVFSGRKTRDLLQDLADALDLEVRDVRTLFDTQTAIFGRQVAALNDDGTEGERFAYLGPVDAKMRPFCAERIGRVYTRAEIDEMDNGQLPNVMLTAGGYNCRHSWTNVSSLSDWNDLVGTTQRIPEIERALRDVRPVKRAKAA